MKAIKIIIGIITGLAVAFFVTGLLVKETNYTTQITVNKPIDEVFVVFSNQENRNNWIPEIKSVETINENIGTIGSTYKVVVSNQEDEITMTEKVIAYIPNEKLTLFYDAENMLKTNDYLFSENKGETTIILNATCKSESYVMSCVFPYFKSVLQEQDQSYLGNFKKYMEENRVDTSVNN